MHPYPYNAEERLEEAQEALSRMKASKTVTDFKRALSSFLNASRFALQTFPKEFKEVEGFREWWEEKAKYLENDELCKFFRQMRNKMTKEGYSPVAAQHMIKGPTTISGPIQIGSGGVFMGIEEGGRAKWKPTAIGGMTTAISFRDAPKQFTNKNPIELAEEYMGILTDIVDEFVREFSRT